MTVLVPLSYSGMIRTPFLQSGLEMQFFGLDHSALRDQNDRWIISGDLIEGNLRHLVDWAFKNPDTSEVLFGVNGRLTRQNILDAFGRESDLRDGGDGPDLRAGMKLFDALLGEGGPAASSTDISEGIVKPGTAAIRVGHDEKTGAAKPAAHFVSEQMHRDNAEVSFFGEGYILISDEHVASQLVAFLNLLASNIVFIGAEKSVGWGRLEKLVMQTGAPKTFSLPSVATSSANDYELRISSERPLLISPRVLTGNDGPLGEAPGGNIFRSLDLIPGNILFGAIDDVLQQSGLAYDGDFLALKAVLTLRHAFPTSTGGTRPIPVTFRQIRLRNGLETRRDDWKEGGVSDNGFPSVLLPELVYRTRTAVDPDTWGPEAQKLFTHVLLSPKGREWVGGISIPEDSPANIKQAFAQLITYLAANGLFRLGKSGTPVRCTLREVERRKQRFRHQRFYLRLLTDTWMARSPDNVRAEYAAYFEKLGVHLVGSEFWAAQNWRRTPKFTSEWLLTRAGSVFSLEGDAEALTRNASPHLPPLEPSDFLSCPYLPSNGYGEYVLEEV